MQKLIGIQVICFVPTRYARMSSFEVSTAAKGEATVGSAKAEGKKEKGKMLLAILR